MALKITFSKIRQNEFFTNRFFNIENNYSSRRNIFSKTLSDSIITADEENLSILFDSTK